MAEQNGENMQKVRELMEQAEKVKLGGELKAGVPIDFTSYFGTHYEGTVVFKRPTMEDYIKMGAEKSEYLRVAGVKDINLVDNSVKFMAHVMSVLGTVIVKCPAWLVDLTKVKEPDVLYHVHEKYEEWENSFRKRNTAEPSGNSEPAE